MGASASSPILLALDGLLRSKGLKVKQSTLQMFLKQVDLAAPWFAYSGSLTTPSWEKLGKDLDFAHEQGTLEGGVIPLWKLVRGCLSDSRCQDALTKGQEVLEQLHEERSEGAESIKSGGSDRDDKRSSQPKTRLYPDLTELKAFEEDSSSDNEEVLELLSRQAREKRGKGETKGRGDPRKAVYTEQKYPETDVGYEEEGEDAVEVPPDPPPYPNPGLNRMFHAQTWRKMIAIYELTFLNGVRIFQKVIRGPLTAAPVQESWPLCPCRFPGLSISKTPNHLPKQDLWVPSRTTGISAYEELLATHPCRNPGCSFHAGHPAAAHVQKLRPPLLCGPPSTNGGCPGCLHVETLQPLP
ncbi:endogenous retrovirus group K member 113 Gag polyprotein-like [Marmota monax]|uniref:endogenous retrovirus group K member 113 Gag polyprotein-like n=1 Tax=Marmota monax TaxID=9995 RepID=UPI0026F2E7D5|nr:endogenous retrovirus group K member 113 Gag polyprotein-like [Marmota monax]